MSRNDPLYVTSASKIDPSSVPSLPAVQRHQSPSPPIPHLQHAGRLGEPPLSKPRPPVSNVSPALQARSQSPLVNPPLNASSFPYAHPANLLPAHLRASSNVRRRPVSTAIDDPLPLDPNQTLLPPQQPLRNYDSSTESGFVTAPSSPPIISASTHSDDPDSVYSPTDTSASASAYSLSRDSPDFIVSDRSTPALLGTVRPLPAEAYADETARSSSATTENEFGLAVSPELTTDSFHQPDSLHEYYGEDTISEPFSELSVTNNVSNSESTPVSPVSQTQPLRSSLVSRMNSSGLAPAADFRNIKVDTRTGAFHSRNQSTSSMISVNRPISVISRSGRKRTSAYSVSSLDLAFRDTPRSPEITIPQSKHQTILNMLKNRKSYPSNRSEYVTYLRQHKGYVSTDQRPPAKVKGAVKNPKNLNTAPNVRRQLGSAHSSAFYMHGKLRPRIDMRLDDDVSAEYDESVRHQSSELSDRASLNPSSFNRLSLDTPIDGGFSPQISVSSLNHMSETVSRGSSDTRNSQPQIPLNNEMFDFESRSSIQSNSHHSDNETNNYASNQISPTNSHGSPVEIQFGTFMPTQDYEDSDSENDFETAVPSHTRLFVANPDLTSSDEDK
ncbi:hypothetical protein CANCADRAFT_42534 [Tortispora caseinolytica NRRL Y-17796]|uniref:Uncharacterized protein n=1 Tax=Tortispora caseinolytica NRRL Y-17796 TaxID=767744 RepID=A0A1E4TJF0_9ASCO|nr:hypothetical protein CANCADRAFT_42534 [Tortispora caseinolytica NRRL Y-17796]